MAAWRFAAAALLLAACADTASVDEHEAGAGSRQSEEAPVEITPVPVDGVPADVVEGAVADLSARLRVPADDVEVLRSEAVTWPDGGLGCPEPGESYPAAEVEGYRVLLQHDGRLFIYHAGADAAPFLCPSGDKDGGHEFAPPPRLDE